MEMRIQLAQEIRYFAIFMTLISGGFRGGSQGAMDPPLILPSSLPMHYEKF